MGVSWNKFEITAWQKFQLNISCMADQKHFLITKLINGYEYEKSFFGISGSFLFPRNDLPHLDFPPFKLISMKYPGNINLIKILLFTFKKLQTAEIQTFKPPRVES